MDDCYTRNEILCYNNVETNLFYLVSLANTDDT